MPKCITSQGSHFASTGFNLSSCQMCFMMELRWLCLRKVELEDQENFIMTQFISRNIWTSHGSKSARCKHNKYIGSIITRLILKGSVMSTSNSNTVKWLHYAYVRTMKFERGKSSRKATYTNTLDNEHNSAQSLLQS